MAGYKIKRSITLNGSRYRSLHRAILNMPTTISIAVCRGDPLDYIKLRHVALHFVYPDGGQSLMHVVGSHGFFEFANEGKDPTKSEKLAGIVHVSTAPDSILIVASETACAHTPVRKDAEHQEGNCEIWVEKALGALQPTGFLSAQQCRSTGQSA
ncbi:hypothetical protein BJX61DRAFT_461476 [Aspergillus egyptiacus]|nr:hypothetical protein BJX61DRAFT_461476 [Aspergillus egyptiacus]